MTCNNKLSIIVIFMLCAAPQTAFCANVNVTSRVSSTNINLNDKLELKITLTGVDAFKAEAPQLGPMPEFTVGSPKKLWNISSYLSRSIVYTYILYPFKPGIFDVGAVSVKIGRDVVTAPAIKVKVVSGPNTRIPANSGNGTAESAGDINVFITADVDKREVYVGEQITYTFMLSYADSIKLDKKYYPPVTTGFRVVDMPHVRDSKEMFGSNTYAVNTIKKALIPTTSGELIVGQTSLIYSVHLNSIHRLVLLTSPSKRLLTEPIAIKVKPLPAKGKPAGFNGAVGNFEISSTIDSTDVRAGGFVTVKVSVTGTGNLNLISSISEPDLSMFKTYDPKITEKISYSGFTFGGLKSWEYVIIPKEQGNTTIGPFTLSYFNPEDNSYHTVSTQQYVLSSVSDIHERGGESITADIRPIKPDKAMLGSMSKRTYTKIPFYLFYILPLGVLISSFAYKHRRDTIRRSNGPRRKLNAFKHAQKRLCEAADMPDAKMLCGTLHETILCYIGDIMNIDTGSLTSDSLEEILRRGGVDTVFVEHIRQTLEMCDFVRFASAANESAFRESLVNDTREIVLKLDGNMFHRSILSPET